MNSSQILEAVNFPVALRKIAWKDAAGYATDIPDRRAVVRLDTGAAMSVVSDQYKLIPYREAVEPLLEHIDKHGGSLINRTEIPRARGVRRQPLRMESDGRRIWIEANFRDGVTIGKDLILPRVVYGNSYDGTSAYRAIVGFFQVKCTNAGALMRPGKVLGMGHGGISRRHIGPMDLDHDGVENHLRQFLSSFGDMANTLRGMVNTSVDPYEADKILREYTGQRFAEKNPADRSELGAWDLYSKVTNYLTMDFKGGQQVSERRAQLALAKIQEVMR